MKKGFNEAEALKPRIPHICAQASFSWPASFNEAEALKPRIPPLLLRRIEIFRITAVP